MTSTLVLLGVVAVAMLVVIYYMYVGDRGMGVALKESAGGTRRLESTETMASMPSYATNKPFYRIDGIELVFELGETE